MKHLLSIVFMALTTCTAASGAEKISTTDTLVVTTNPQMHCEGCETKIKSGLRFVKGTKKVITSVPKQTVTIIYDKSKANVEAYTKAFGKIGYKIRKL